MEANFDEGISDEVLKGSFLALKQLQTKGKKVNKLQKSPSTIQKEAGPRSRLYEKFKEVNGFGKTFPEPLDTSVPKSFLMYQTYKEILSKKRQKVRYTEETKPMHPFFGKNAVLAEDFKRLDTNGSSSTFTDVIESMELEGLIKKYNYDMAPRGEIIKIKPAVIKPLKPKSTKKPLNEPKEILSEEFIESLQRVLIDSEDEA